jgi:SAM-dependent methyltransferase
MSYSYEVLKDARVSLQRYRAHAVSKHHERYSFPLLSGTYFSYRKIDVLRVVSIAYSISKEPTFLDVGCGFGDFLKKIREYIPQAYGIERNSGIFYDFGIHKPEFIRIADARWGIEQDFDIIFIGWMDPGVDFRDAIQNKTDVVITTLDQGLSLAAEFDGHGYKRIAYWRTPSWEDVNSEIMNRHYTKTPFETILKLSNLRSAHNLWYIYCSNEKKSEVIMKTLRQKIEEESKSLRYRYDFEDVLDECGFRYQERMSDPISGNGQRLWEIYFDNN